MAPQYFTLETLLIYTCSADCHVAVYIMFVKKMELLPTPMHVYIHILNIVSS